MYNMLFYGFLQGKILIYTKEIAVPEWMQRAETARLMAVLNAGSHSPAALFVGGCVRNTLLNRPVGDIDIATILTPDVVIGKLQAAGIKVVPTGIDHGTVTAIVDGQPFEITTLRKDVETDGRHAVISFTEDWAEDAQRRDFTMNTLLADEQGRIYDPTGRGLSDLDAQHVIFVGDTAQRIAEDYLRILRFFRFHAYYGMGTPDEAALVACRTAADKISTLSRERITQEFLKILALDVPTPILSLMFENGVLKDLPATSYNQSVLEDLCGLQFRYESDGNSVLARLAVLANFEKAQLKSWDNLLILSNAQRSYVEALLNLSGNLSSVTEKLGKALIYKYGWSTVMQSIFLVWARSGSPGDPELIIHLRTWREPSLPVSGHDLKALGVEEGPEMGRILSDLEKWWIDNDFEPDHDSCLEQIKIYRA